MEGKKEAKVAYIEREKAPEKKTAKVILVKSTEQTEVVLVKAADQVLLKKRFQCNVCLRSYSTKWNLKQHQRVHDESLAFKCEECGKVFSNRILLKSHMLIHTGRSRLSAGAVGRSSTRRAT